MKSYLIYTVFAMMKIGVLDIQGSVEEHMESLRKLAKNGLDNFPENKSPLSDSALYKPKGRMGSSLGEAGESDMLNIQPVLVKTVEQLKQVRGLIIPGGESTTIGKLLRRFGLREEIIKRAKSGELAVWGTCAGAILLARKIIGKELADSLELMDIVVERNAYGRQLESFEAEIEFGHLSKQQHYKSRRVNTGKSTPGGQTKNFSAFSQERIVIPAIFIRAPRIVSVGKGAEILAYYRGEGPADVYSEIRDGGEAVNARNGVRDGGEIVAVREKNLLATTFHPELTENLTLHRYFVEMCKEI